MTSWKDPTALGEASVWTDIGGEEEAIFATHRPGGWERERERHYVAVRRRQEGGQPLSLPFTVLPDAIPR